MNIINILNQYNSRILVLLSSNFFKIIVFLTLIMLILENWDKIIEKLKKGVSQK